MRFFITGGTGFIGRALIAELLKSEHQVTVITRNLEKAAKILGSSVTLIQSLSEISQDAEFDWVINLAGAGVADRPWTKRRKWVLQDSRILFTQQLVNVLNGLSQPPKYMISASAVGYYGDQKGEVCNEASEPGEGFTADLCARWERAALDYNQEGGERKVYILRLGVVLERSGGLLQRMLPSFKFGLGTVFGRGKQNFPWVHRYDVIAFMQYVINNHPQNTTYNLVAPQLVSQREFAKSISGQLNRPLWVSVPEGFLRFILKDQSALFLDDAKVVPEAIQALDFTYEYPELNQVLH